MYDKDGNALEIGSNDKYINVTEDLDGNGVIGNRKDLAIASYNKAVENINNFCKEIVTVKDKESVRSIGASEDKSGDYNSENLKLWFGDITLKEEDEYWEEDFIKLTYWNIANTGNYYWIASRSILEHADTIGLCPWGVDSSGELAANASTLYFNNKGDFLISNTDRPVRPVVVNPQRDKIQYVD